MDQDVSRKIKEAWAQGKDASGANAFQENGEIALSEKKEQEPKKHFQEGARGRSTERSIGPRTELAGFRLQNATARRDRAVTATNSSLRVAPDRRCT